MPIQDILALLMLLVLCGLTVALFLRKPRGEFDPKLLRDELDRLEGRMRTEFEAGRRESADNAKNLRQELGTVFQDLSRTLQNQVVKFGDIQQQQFKEFSDRLEALRNSLVQSAQSQREELARTQQSFTEGLTKRIREQGESQERQLAKLNEDLTLGAQSQRKEQSESLKSFNDSMLNAMTLMGSQQKEQVESFRNQVGELIKTNETRMAEMATSHAAKLERMIEADNKNMEQLRMSLDQKLEAIRQAMVEQLDKVRQENAGKLEEMRKTVDEKLHDTLEKRLGESFKQVSDRLEQVHKGLGEMQSLATGVGDLKKVLANVKTRGTWGEIQLGNLLEQILAPEQYVQHARPKPRSLETVEFAIKLPGRDDGDNPVLLPIDAKFPREDYERLVDASEKGDVTAMDEAAKALESRIKQEARDIRDKYIEPPHTTDFAILYLPIEGLYAEVLRRPGLAEWLQRDCRVTIAGPTTLAALLNSLQMGFRTLAIQKRSSEVWKILGAVKKKFESFAETFNRVQKKIQEADKELDRAKEDTRIMGSKLKGVDSMTEVEATRVLDLPAGIPEENGRNNLPGL